MKFSIFFSIILLTGCASLIRPNTVQEPAQEPVRKGTVQESSRDNTGTQTSNSLDLSGQGLTALPKYVLSMENLEVLDISHNKMTGALPAEIRQLKRLRVLDASDNRMTGIPAEVGQLSELQTLDVSNNQLTGLPYEIGNLKNLKTLDLTGNNYAQQDLQIIKEKLPGLVVLD